MGYLIQIKMKFFSYSSIAIALLLANSQEANAIRLQCPGGDDKLKTVLRAIADSDSGSSCSKSDGGPSSATASVPIIIPMGGGAPPPPYGPYGAPPMPVPAPAPAPAPAKEEPKSCPTPPPAPVVVKSKDKSASAARKAERSVKLAIDKIEKKMDDKDSAKDTVAAIEKVKEEQK